MGLKRSIVLISVAGTLLAGCHDDNTLGLGVPATDQFSATLSGANVRPVPVATSATATVALAIRTPEIGQSSRTMSVVVTTSNLTAATAVHIHLGGASVSNGQILATLYTNSADTALTSSTLLSGFISESALDPVGIDSLKTLVNVGAAYVDIHTTSTPNGLIRGQLTRIGQPQVGDAFAAPLLTGGKERPNPVVSTATGSATFELLTGSSIRYKIDVVGLTGVLMAHIHTGVADSAGPIAVTLFGSTVPTGPLTGTLASGTFSAANIQLPGISLDSLLSLMRRGRTYVNVHTQLNPSGEIRAQIDPVSVLPK